MVPRDMRVLKFFDQTLRVLDQNFKVKNVVFERMLKFFDQTLRVLDQILKWKSKM